MSNLKQYRKKPVIIEAMLFDGKNGIEANKFVGGAYEVDEDDLVYINTLEGLMHVSPGDYIIKGVQGEFYACKPDIFEATYEGALP